MQNGKDRLHQDGGSLSRLASAIGAGRPPEGRLDLLLTDCALRLQSNTPALLKELAPYYAPFRGKKGAPDLLIDLIEAPSPQFNRSFIDAPPTPGTGKLSEAYHDLPDGRIVVKKRTGVALLFGGGVNLAIGPLSRYPNQVINFISDRYVQWRVDRGCILCHAAAVTRGNSGLALAGLSGSGKTTLALHLLEQGFELVTDDLLLLMPGAEGLRMLGVPRRPKINPGTALGNGNLKGLIADTTRGELEKLDGEALWKVRGKGELDGEALWKVRGKGELDRPGQGGLSPSLSARLTALLILNWQRRPGPSTLHPLDLDRRRDLLPHIRKSKGLYLLEKRGGKGFDLCDAAYLRLLAGTRLYELGGEANFQEAVRACLGILVRRGPFRNESGKNG